MVVVRCGLSAGEYPRSSLVAGAGRPVREGAEPAQCE